MQLTAPILTELQYAQVIGNTVKLVRQLDRNLYVQVNKILEAIGGKWNKKAKAHLFDEDPWDRISEVVTTGKVDVVDLKKEFQFYETPADLADQMVQAANLQRGHRILEPSAGQGAILKAIWREFPGKNVAVCELMPANLPILGRLPDGVTFLTDDFLRLDRKHKCERIIANPPFRRGQDVDHVKKMFDHLTPGGRLVAITSPGWTYRTDRRHTEFKQWFESVNGDYDELPEGTFRASGTDVRTLMLTIDRSA